MVDLALSDDEKEIRSWVRTFVTKELLPSSPTRWPASVAVSAVYRSRSCAGSRTSRSRPGSSGSRHPRPTAGWACRR